MNIWCISKYASPPKYGAAARLFFLTKEFIKLGHEAILITSDSNHFAKFPQTDQIYNFEEMDGVPVHWIKTKKYKKTASFSRVLSWFDFERHLFLFNTKALKKPDVVIVSSLSIFTIFYGYYLKKKYGASLVFEVRDIWPLTMTEEGNFSKWHPLVLLIGMVEKFAYNRADLIVGTMPKLDLHVKNILGYERPFYALPLGFDEQSYQEVSETDNNCFLDVFPKGKMIVGYAGSMGITNALEPFIEAIKLLKDNNKIHFMLVGGGSLKEKFENELVDCGNVSFLQKIEQHKVRLFLKKCDVVYLSTQQSKVWEYGQSMNKFIEYMLAAKPIIASYTGYPSMLNEADCGVFIDSDKPMDIENEILKFYYMTDEERSEIGKRGRKWIMMHRSYRALAKDYMSRLELLIGPNSPQ